MKINYKKLSLAIASALMPLGLLSHAGAASANQQLEITPTAIIQSFDKGASQAETLQVINPGSSSYDIKIYATPFSVTGEDYKQNFNKIPGAEDVSTWFSFPSSTYHIDPNQTVNIPYFINVPSNALAGGHYATVFVETQNKANVNGVVIHDRLGSVAYLTVNGPVKTAGNFLSWNASFLQRPDLTANLRVQNTGAVHFQTTINAVVKDIFGSTRLTYYSTHEILPQTIRKMPVVWNKTPSFGLFRISGTANFLGQTVNLPTQYVLVMSSFVRLVLALLVFLIILWFVVKIYFSPKKSNGSRVSNVLSKVTVKNATKKTTTKKVVKKAPAKKSAPRKKK
jgi:hypothetical protein